MRSVLFQILSLIFLFALNLTAQTFTASVNKTKVGDNERFQIEFTFKGKDINNLSNFRPPEFSDFLVISGPNNSTSMQIINGNVSASRVISFYLQPRRIGNFTIGKASIEYEGKTYTSDPIKMEVVKGATQPKQQQHKDNEREISQEEIQENLFIRTFADKTTLYKGEQVTVTYKLYTRLNITSQMSVSKLPQYQGFWAEEIGTSNNILFDTEVYNGKRYRVGVLKRVALFPSQSGELSVTPFEINVPVQVRTKSNRSRSLLDDFFNDPFFGGSKTIEVKAKSNTIKLNVKPLPEGAPESFAGAVGSFKLNSEIDKTITKTNEPVSLKVTISGTGNIKLLDVPELNLPTGFESYDPKVDESISRSGQISGKKTIEYLFVPRIAGKKEIPPIEFSYFDPDKKEYITLTTDPYNIEIKQGESGNVTASKENVKLLNDDIRFIKTDYDLDKKNGIILLQPGFWVVTVFPLLALIGLVAWKKRDEKLSSDVELLRYRKAQKMARKRLQTAKTLMEQGEEEKFYSEVSLAIQGYLENKFKILKSEFTIELAAEQLQKKGVDEKLIFQLKDTFEKCEFIRFAPGKDGASKMNEIYNEASELIINIEKSIASK